MRPAILLWVLLGVLPVGAGAIPAEDVAYLGIRLEYEEEPAAREGRMVIVTVYPESPASKAGLQVGDVLIRVNGVAFRFPDWNATMEKGGPFTWARAGDKIRFTLLRAGKSLELDLVAGALPPEVLETRRRYGESVLLKTGSQVLDRLAKDNARVRVERTAPAGDLRASAPGLTADDAAALSHFLATSRLSLLFGKLEPGGSLQLQLGIQPGTSDPSIAVFSP